MASFLTAQRMPTTRENILLANTLIIISGFSGSGKSTLIDHLVSGRLEADLADRFPQGCAHWPQLHAVDLRNGICRIKPLVSTAEPRGAILHYEINHHCKGKCLQPFESDPIFSLLEGIPSIIFVVTRPTVSQLIEQFSDRTYRRMHGRGYWHELFRKCVKVPLQDLRHLVHRTPRQAYDVLYENGDWLRACATLWDRFVRTWTRTLPNVSVLCVQPASGSWRVVELKPKQLLPIDLEPSGHAHISQH